jgi:hypothetical protein
MRKTVAKRLSTVLAVAMVVSGISYSPAVSAQEVKTEIAAPQGNIFIANETEAGVPQETTSNKAISGETTSAGETTKNGNGETPSGNKETGSETVSESSSETVSETASETTPITTPETTTVDYVIIDELYKVKDGVLIEFLGKKDDKTLTQIVLPKGIKKINDRIFAEYTNITTFTTVADSDLEEIGKEAFKGCNALKVVTLPGKLKVIGDQAFADCTVMGNVVLPQSLTDMGTDTFSNCLAMTEISIPMNVTKGVEILGKASNVKKVTFEVGMTKIPDDIVKNCTSITEVVIPSGVKTIGGMAFYGCLGLTNVTLPNTVTTIKHSAFNACKNLATVTAYSGIKTIDKKAFKSCKALTSFTMFKTITTVGEGAFLYDTNLVLKVYQNSFGKKYAINNQIKWEYTESEIKRQARCTEIHNTLMSKVSKKYGIKHLDNYVPQGLCVIGKYVYVSMYHKTNSKKSLILMYNKSTKAYVKYFKIGQKDHVGSLTNVKGRLVVSLNNIAAADTLGIIDYKKTVSIKKGKTIKYTQTVKLPGYADFAGFDGTVFWAGRSANDNNCTMQGYKVTVKKKKLVFTKKYSFAVPANCQGLIVTKATNSSKRNFLFAQSYGLIADSYLISYSCKVNKAKTLGNPTGKRILPSMLEGICKTDKGNMFMVFESGAGLYCTDPTHTTEIQENDICMMKYSQVPNLAAN